MESKLASRTTDIDPNSITSLQHRLEALQQTLIERDHTIHTLQQHDQSTSQDHTTTSTSASQTFYREILPHANPTPVSEQTAGLYKQIVEVSHRSCEYHTR